MSMWHMWVRFIWVRNVLPDMTRTTHIFTVKSKEGNTLAKDTHKSQSISPHPGQKDGAMPPNLEQTHDAYCASLASRLLKPVWQ